MFNPDNIMRIDFVERLAGIEIENIALFNKNNTTDQEAQKAIDLHGMGNNPKVIIISKEQFNNIFKGE
jgi:hypothetical protein